MYRTPLTAILSVCLATPLAAVEPLPTAVVEAVVAQPAQGFSSDERAALVEAEAAAIDQDLQEQRAAGISNDRRFWVGAGVAAAVILLLIIIL